MDSEVINNTLDQLNQLESAVESEEDEGVHDLVCQHFGRLREDLEQLRSERGE